MSSYSGGDETCFGHEIKHGGPKNKLAYLKRKRLLNVSNIKQIYNVHARNNNAVRGPRSEIHQLLKLLEDDHYVSRDIVYEDKVIVRDIFWTHPVSINSFNIFSIMLVVDSTYKTNSIKFHSWKLLVLLLRR